jgi:hypothetical protein
MCEPPVSRLESTANVASERFLEKIQTVQIFVVHFHLVGRDERRCQMATLGRMPQGTSARSLIYVSEFERYAGTTQKVNSRNKTDSTV